MFLGWENYDGAVDVATSSLTTSKTAINSTLRSSETSLESLQLSRVSTINANQNTQSSDMVTLLDVESDKFKNKAVDNRNVMVGINTSQLTTQNNLLAGMKAIMDARLQEVQSHEFDFDHDVNYPKDEPFGVNLDSRLATQQLYRNTMNDATDSMLATIDTQKSFYNTQFISAGDGMSNDVDGGWNVIRNKTENNDVETDGANGSRVSDLILIGDVDYGVYDTAIGSNQISTLIAVNNVRQTYLDDLVNNRPTGI